MGRQGLLVPGARRAADLDPVSVQVHSTLGLTCWYGGRTEEALAAYRKALELNPGSQAIRGLLGSVYLTQSRPDRAQAELSQVTDDFWRLPGMAMVHHTQGRTPESDRALGESIERYQTGGAYNAAQVYAFRGQPNEAFRWLERAYVQHDGGVFLVKFDPLLANLRSDARFEALLRKLHLSDRDLESRVRPRQAGGSASAPRSRQVVSNESRCPATARLPREATWRPRTGVRRPRRRRAVGGSPLPAEYGALDAASGLDSLYPL